MIMIKYLKILNMFKIEILVLLLQRYNSTNKKHVTKVMTPKNSKNEWMIGIEYTSVFCPWKTHTVVHSPACRTHTFYTMIMIYIRHHFDVLPKQNPENKQNNTNNIQH